MFTRFKATCERVRRNNGIVEVLLTLRAEQGDAKSKEHHVLMNLPIEYGEFEKGRDYFVHVQPAFPHR